MSHSLGKGTTWLVRVTVRGGGRREVAQCADGRELVWCKRVGYRLRR